MIVLYAIAHLIVLFLVLFDRAIASNLPHLLEVLNIQQFDAPELDFNNTSNSIQLLGDIEQIDFYRYTGQQNFTSGLGSNSNSSNLIYYSQDFLIKLQAGSNDTNIKKIVPVGEDSFILSGTGTLDGYSLDKQLIYNLTSLSLEPIFNQSLNSINTIFVDKDIVYFGGNFTYSSGSNEINSVISWNSTDKNVSILPFSGFGNDSVVNSILSLDEDNLLFIGKFSELDDNSWLIYNYTNVSSNITIQRKNSTRNELEQQIPLKLATWDVGSSTFNEDNFVCNIGSSGWLMKGTSGSFQVTLPYTVSPSKIRIYNSDYDDNAVSQFRIITTPSNGIMNLTYIDPMTGRLEYCDAFCPLLSSFDLSSAFSNSTLKSTQTMFLNDNTTEIGWSNNYQEFGFVNNVDVSTLQYFALSSYGNNVALSTIELFQSSHSVYANNSYNQASCESTELDMFSNSVLSDNGWFRALPSQSYIQANFQTDSSSVPMVEFYPNIEVGGNFSIKIYTPGCLADNTCNARSIVNVTVSDPVSNKILSTQLIYQNNNELKYDVIYNGYLDFSPKITLSYHSPIIPSTVNAVVVADRIDLTPTYIDVENLTLTNFTETQLQLQLNGLFQYQISNFTSNSNIKIGNTSLHQFAVSQYPSSVDLVGATFNNSLVLAGSVDNIFQLKLDSYLDIVEDIVVRYTGGTSAIDYYSEGLLLFGSYNISSSNIVDTLAYNGTIFSFGELSSSISSFSNFTYEGSELLFFNEQFIFNVSSNSYINNNSSFAASISAASSNSNDDTLLFGNIFQSMGVYNNQSLELNGDSTVENIPFPMNVVPYYGIFLNETSNLYVFQDDQNSRFIYGTDVTASLYLEGDIRQALFSSSSSLLFINSIATNGTSRFIISNITNNSLLVNEILGKNSAEYISSMIDFEKNNTVLISGNFTIEDVGCQGLCLYNYDKNEWLPFANNTFKGSFSGMQIWNSEQLLLSGVFETKNTSEINFASYNMTGNELNVMTANSDHIIDSFAYNMRNIIAWNNSTIMEYSSNQWENITMHNLTSVNIKNVEIISSKSDNSTANTEDILFAFGEFDSTRYGRLNAMLYHSRIWQPYFTLDENIIDSIGGISLFTNKDISAYFNSNSTLSPTNSVTIVSSTTSRPATSTAVVDKNQGKSSKIDRGFVVLIGLALAIGTVVILGLFGVTIAYIFKSDDNYESIKPRIDESEMLLTVPPEKLMKFI